MTDAQLQRIYQENLVKSHISALKAVFIAGYCAKSGDTWVSNMGEIARNAAAPSAIPVINHQ